MKKLITPLGKISIYIDGISTEYKAVRLKNNPSVFPNLGGRYRIELNYVSDNLEHFIICVIDDIDPSKVKKYAESGEKLECQSFYKEDIKLSIGIECDTGYYDTGERVGSYDYDSVYLENGIGYHILPMTKSHKFIFGLAWIDECREEDEIQTWFGADPTNM